MNGHGHEKDDVKDDLGFGDLSLGDTSEFANPNYAANGNGNGNGAASTVKAAEAGGGFDDSRTLRPEARLTRAEEQGLKRSLTSRHISFIGFGGGIGVGAYRSLCSLATANMCRSVRRYRPVAGTGWASGHLPLICHHRSAGLVCREYTCLPSAPG